MTVTVSIASDCALSKFPALVRFALQSILRRDSQNIAVDFLGEPIVAQHDVQALVPGNFVEDQSHRSANRRVQHNVQPADFMNQAEEILQIHVLEIHRNRVSRIFLFRRGRSSRSLRIRRRRILRRGSRRLAGRTREAHVLSRQPGRERHIRHIDRRQLARGGLSGRMERCRSCQGQPGR